MAGTLLIGSGRSPGTLMPGADPAFEKDSTELDKLGADQRDSVV
jgi:hypothetical protein